MLRLPLLYELPPFPPAIDLEDAPAPASRVFEGGVDSGAKASPSSSPTTAIPVLEQQLWRRERAHRAAPPPLPRRFPVEHDAWGEKQRHRVCFGRRGTSACSHVTVCDRRRHVGPVLGGEEEDTGLWGSESDSTMCGWRSTRRRRTGSRDRIEDRARPLSARRGQCVGARQVLSRAHTVGIRGRGPWRGHEDTAVVHTRL